MEVNAATRNAEERKKLIRNSVTFAVICGYLSALNYFTSPYPWALWVIGGWGIAIALQWMYYLLDC